MALPVEANATPLLSKQGLSVHAEFDISEFEELRSTSIVLDVLPFASFRAGHIPGAINLPVGQIQDTAHIILPQRDAKIVVYCAGPTCPLGPQAMIKLAELGYTNVSYFKGGLEEWRAAGHTLASSPDMASPAAQQDGLLRLVDALTIGQWAALWCAMVLVSAGLYWIGTLTPWPGLFHDGRPVPTGWQGFLDCLYFSVVTATTLGYGDIVPLTPWSRVLAATEAIGGMFFVGALISRLLTAQQEKLLRDTHNLAFQERLGRMQTSLHLLIADFQDMEARHTEGKIDQSRFEMRLSSGATILVRDLRIVQELLQDQAHQADEISLELLLATLNSALHAYLDVFAICRTGQERIASQLGRIVSEICSECMPKDLSNEVVSLIRRTELLGQRLLGMRGL